MAIPEEALIKEAILKELYQCKDTEYSLTAQETYQNTYYYFEDALTDDEVNIRYENSASKWANAVQWARKHLIDEGLLLPLIKSGRNRWTLSEKGIKKGKELYLIMMDGEDMYPDELEIQIKSDLNSLEEELTIEYKEGKIKDSLSSKYERNLALRKSTIEIHGKSCQVCQFDFYKTYGELGKDFIEVHHLIPISYYKDEHAVNPNTEMAVLCANCHRMMHRSKNKILTINELKKTLKI
ncbi:MAG TPA: HNH endonuclease [Chitinophagales bacterium]|nr:HNH endonuclease [Chitinophagales bacterium]